MAKRKSKKNKKGLTVFFVCDAVVIAVLIVALLMHQGTIPKNILPFTGGGIKAVSQNEKHFAHSDENSLYEDSYENILSRTSYSTDKGKFSFGTKNKYSGYFDDRNKDIKGAYYSLYYDDDEHVCHLVITYKKKIVWYDISINDDNSLSLLPFGDTGYKKIRLKN